MTPTLYLSDGASMPINPQNGKRFTFKELYSVLECSMIEIVYLLDGTMLLIDEEGRFKKSPVINDQATEVALTALAKEGRTLMGGTIVGHAVHCSEEHLR